MSESYYNILGIDENASGSEIKKAYRTLSMKYHPDKNPGDHEAVGKFQKIGEAYETLSDPEKRVEYDTQRKNPFMRMNSHFHNSGPMDIPMDDIFSAFFGGGGIPGMGRSPFPFPGMPPDAKIHIFHGGPFGGGSMPFHNALQKPSPIIKNVSINMEQVLTGLVMPIDIERWIIENGNKVFENETIYVTVPEGIDDGELIILRDKGNIINENIKGDIKIFVKIINETEFKRSGLDLILEKSISLKDALCGCSFDIKYINGKSYTLNNNPGNIIVPEFKKIVNKMGLKRGEHIGNMIIIFHIIFPSVLTSEQISKIKDIL
jgi:DnaJ-class molecular chaperone